MMGQRLRLALALVLVLPMRTSGEESCAPKSTEAHAFIGTWVLAMTNPQGAHETVRIWDKDGLIAASVQSERVPPIEATGIFKSGDTLLLTLTRFENGRTDRAVIALTINGDTMAMAQMLEFSETIKRGTGKKQDGAPSPRRIAP